MNLNVRPDRRWNEAELVKLYVMLQSLFFVSKWLIPEAGHSSRENRMSGKMEWGMCIIMIM